MTRRRVRQDVIRFFSRQDGYARLPFPLRNGKGKGEPGHYHVDEVSSGDDAFPSGHTSRRWGVGIKRADGSVVDERDPWP
jgi:hypothetical protein